MPEFAVIGMLFERDPHVRVVESTARGLLQHDLMTWQLQGSDVCEISGVSPRAAAMNAAFDSWLQEATLADRRAFTDACFGALRAAGEPSSPK